jgi:hypothetical protein
METIDAEKYPYKKLDIPGTGINLPMSAVTTSDANDKPINMAGRVQSVDQVRLKTDPI